MRRNVDWQNARWETQVTLKNDMKEECGVENRMRPVQIAIYQ
jgi:hypothetical protein